ncbi:hypothetical protein RB653_002384 [Dictyostelium firmibasis]|uniref:Uncharacterized protein n=1 Tax=Dictyostelium firmibasis TaxID=79012 RepID=A0AAN7U8Q3_9MYCE
MTIVGSITKIGNPKKISNVGSISNINSSSIYSINKITCDINSGSGLLGGNLLGNILGGLSGNNTKHAVYHPAVSATGETIYICASISKIGNIKSSSSSSIGSGRNSSISFGNNRISCGECGGSANPMGLIGNVANQGTGMVTQIPVTIMVDASLAMNPSFSTGNSCGCN